MPQAPATNTACAAAFVCFDSQEVLEQESCDGGEAIRQRLQQHYMACIDDIQQQHATAIEGLQHISSLVESLQGAGGAGMGEAAGEGTPLGGEQQAELEGALAAMQTLEQQVAYVSTALTVDNTRLSEVQAVEGPPNGLGERQPALLLADHGVSFLASLLTDGSTANLVVIQEAQVTAGETSSMLVTCLLNDSTLHSVREAHAAGQPVTLSTDSTAVVYVAHSHGTGLALCGSHLEVLYPAMGWTTCSLWRKARCCCRRPPLPSRERRCWPHSALDGRSLGRWGTGLVELSALGLGQVHLQLLVQGRPLRPVWRAAALDHLLGHLGLQQQTHTCLWPSVGCWVAAR